MELHVCGVTGGWVLFDVNGPLATNRDWAVLDELAGDLYRDRYCLIGRQPNEEWFQRDTERAKARDEAARA